MSSKSQILLSRFTPFVAGVLLMMAPAARAQVQFSGPTDYPVGTTPGNIAVGDFNGDGKQDLAVANQGSANVTILLGNGDGTFQQAREIGVNGTPAFVAVGDFNGDRKLDLAVAEGLANIVLIFLGNGDGSFQAPEQFNTDISADYVAVADFNNDTRSDLLVSTEGSVGILLGIGDGRFQSPIVTPIAYATAGYVAIGDFNQDGKLDVATGYGTGHYLYAPFCCPINGNVTVLAGNGDGTFRPPVMSPDLYRLPFRTPRKRS